MPAAPSTAVSTTLDAKAWVDAAFDALARGGIDAVRVERLAKDLGVTRGSFYWHFKDRAALYKAMLNEWRSTASVRIFRRLETEKKPVKSRLSHLLALPFASPKSERAASIELAIRLWARADKSVAAAVAQVDRRRLAYFAQLFEEHGASKEDARGRAFLFYAYLMAEAIIIVDKKSGVLEACERALLEVTRA